jgi:hypothetical protein
MKLVSVAGVALSLVVLGATSASAENYRWVGPFATMNDCWGALAVSELNGADVAKGCEYVYDAGRQGYWFFLHQ